MRTPLLIAAALICVSSASLARAQDPSEKPAQLDVLNRYVGDWTSDVTSNPAVWTPEEVRLVTSNHAEFILDGWFLQIIEVNHVVDDPDKVGKGLFLWTYDSVAEQYVSWIFQSSGNGGKSTGRWNPDDAALRFTLAESPQDTTAWFQEAFTDDDTIDGHLVFTGNDSRTMFDMEWTRSRQQGLVPNRLREEWTVIGTPIEPLPEELQKLEPFIGEWDSEFINRPSAVSPNGGTSSGTMTAQWILDGRFLHGRSEVGNHKSVWVIGYDTNRNTYRYVRMTNTGRIYESIGEWNEATRSFSWNLENAPAGVTRTSTNRIVGDGAINAHILVNDEAGRPHMDLSIRSTRRD